MVLTTMRTDGTNVPLPIHELMALTSETAERRHNKNGGKLSDIWFTYRLRLSNK
jgi:hypothetical protein